MSMFDGKQRNRGYWGLPAHWALALLVAVSAMGLSGCGGGGGGILDSAAETLVGSILPSEVDGEFQAPTGLTISIDPETKLGKVIAFGESIFGTNSGLLKQGDEIARNIQRNGDGSYTGDFFVPSVSSGQMVSGSFQSLSFYVEDNTVVFDSSAPEPYAGTWNRVSSGPTGGRSTDTSGLSSASSCDEWMNAIVGRSWTILRIADNFGTTSLYPTETVEVNDATLVIERNSWRITGFSKKLSGNWIGAWSSVVQGTEVETSVGWDPGNCRIVLKGDTSGHSWVHTFFPQSLSNGELLMSLGPWDEFWVLGAN